MTTQSNSLRFASLGSISSGTLRTVDLLETFANTLEGLQTVNGAFLALPENRVMRDRVANLIGQAQDCWNEDGNGIAAGKESDAEWLVSELQDELQAFAPPFAYFGTHEGDGACFGFWVNLDDVKEQVEFVSSKRQEWPDSDYRGEWLHVSDHGNATLYVREDADGAEGYVDREIWGIV